MALTLTRGIIVTSQIDNFFEIKKLKKKTKKKTDTCHVLFKNVNYLNTVSKKDQIDQNLTKMMTELNTTKMRSKLNKKNENLTVNLVVIGTV